MRSALQQSRPQRKRSGWLHVAGWGQPRSPLRLSYRLEQAVEAWPYSEAKMLPCYGTPGWVELLVASKPGSSTDQKQNN